jgi:hypothetical protein
MAETQPHFVNVRRNPRGGLVHFSAIDNRWHAADGSGSRGLFDSREEATAAILAAPPAPRRKRPPKPKPPDFLKTWRIAGGEGGFIVRDQRGRAIGAVMPAGGRFEAWFKGALIGKFDAPQLAESAVFAAHHRAKKRRKAP